MKFWRRYLALGVVTYFLFIVTQLPANNVYYFAKDSLKEQGVSLYGVQGSIWNGSASAATYKGMPFEKIAWEIYPLALLTANISAAIRFKQNNNSVNAIISRSFFGSTKIENARVKADAAELMKLAKIPMIKLKGEFNLNLPLLILDDKKVETIKGRLVWNDAESHFPEKIVLGNLFADMSTSSDGVIQIKLGDGGGPLEIDGNLLLTPDGKYDFKSLLSARKGRNSPLGRSLKMLGSSKNGKIEFNKAGEQSEFSFLL